MYRTLFYRLSDLEAIVTPGGEGAEMLNALKQLEGNFAALHMITQQLRADATGGEGPSAAYERMLREVRDLPSPKEG